MTRSESLLQPIEAWFLSKGWTPQDFQQQAWKAHLKGASGLIQVPLDQGKPMPR